MVEDFAVGAKHMSAPPQYLSAIVSDIAGAFQIPGGSVLGQAIQDLFAKRMKQARDILVEQIRSGEKDIYEAADVDEVVAIVYRYMRAAQEGTARINLQLFARIIAGQKAHGALKADEFLYYADLIASLRHEEIVLLGAFARELANEIRVVRESNLDPSRSENVPERRSTKALDKVLIPSIFSSHSELWATASALSRTGLMVIAHPSFDGPYFTLTPIFEKMNALASLENLETEAVAT